MKPEESFLIRIEPVAGWSTPGIQRLKMALKVLLRSFGLRCREIRPADDAEPGAVQVAADTDPRN